MPHRIQAPFLSPANRRREAAAILALGVVRLRRMNRTVGVSATPESSPGRHPGLDLPAETRLSASDGTRGLRLREDGDDA